MNAQEKRILLIDDREEWLSLAEATLVQSGYRVFKAHNLEEAQSIIVQEGNSFDLIIADQLQIEHSKNTLYDLIWAEPDRRRRVVVLFNTEPTLPRMRDIFKLGVYDCVAKHDEPERLVEFVQSSLENRLDK